MRKRDFFIVLSLMALGFGTLLKYPFLWPVFFLLVLTFIPNSISVKKHTLLNAAFKFARVRIIVSTFAIACLGAAIAGGPVENILLFFLLLVPVTIHANSLNDFTDLSIDKLNLHDASDRPLVTGDITRRTLWLIHFGSGIVALLVAVLYGANVVLLTIGVLMISYLYSLKPFRLSDRGILSQLILSIAYVFFPLSVGYWSSSSDGRYPWLIAGGLFFAFVARLLLKDLRDIVGDKKYGKKTFLIRHGRKTTCLASGIFWIVAVLLILKTTSFSIGVTIPLLLGLIFICFLLFFLSKENSISKQQEFVNIIARSANIAILTVFAYYLCEPVASLTTTERVLIPGIIGTSLLLVNLIRSRKILAV